MGEAVNWSPRNTAHLSWWQDCCSWLARQADWWRNSWTVEKKSALLGAFFVQNFKYCVWIVITSFDLIMNVELGFLQARSAVVYLWKGFCRKACDWKMLMKACFQISIFKAQPFRRNENLWRCFLGSSFYLITTSLSFVNQRSLTERLLSA